jgi:hypothetical protein
MKCTVHDGVIWMHLHDTSVSIPSNIANESQLLMIVLSSAADTDFTLAPKEWLEAWASRYCIGRERLHCANIRELVCCLLVCVSAIRQYLPVDQNLIHNHRVLLFFSFVKTFSSLNDRALPHKVPSLKSVLVAGS